MSPTPATLALTDALTSPAFKQRWGEDAIARFQQDLQQDRYFIKFDQTFIDDMRKEQHRIQHSDAQPMTADDFTLPAQAWQPASESQR